MRCRTSSLLTLCFLALACGDDDRRVVGDEDTGPREMGMATSDQAVRIDQNVSVDMAAVDGPNPIVDPRCLDGQYTETLPNVSAPIDDVPFESIGQYTDAVLDRRYPVGAAIVRGGRTSPSFPGDCDEEFASVFGPVTSGADVIRSMGFIVHECGHVYDRALSTVGEDVYFLTSDLTLSCQRGDTTSRGGDTFARSRIRRDSFSALRPPGEGAGMDSYGDIYLDGDPDDADFDSGDQGFNLLFEEFVQYTNSLAEAWAFRDQLPQFQSTSGRDGILTFAWYLQRYLRMARTEFPDAYARITNDCWRPAILSAWGRAWLFIDATEGMDNIGINDAAIYELATDPELLGEIQRLRELDGC
ncbi:MAG: hypothetical protein AAF411_01560 [Myxococcota bacterium]